jgi:hypothetical protein
MIANMKWLLSKLGFFGKESPKQNLETTDSSFLSVSNAQGIITCKWKLRDASKTMIARDFGSRLLIRIRDVSGDGSTSSKTTEVPINQTEATIELPAAKGRVLIDLGYRLGPDFITLEYQFLDLGLKKAEKPQYIDWFTQESSNIHEEMYELALGGQCLGGSEVIHQQP